MPAWKLNRVRVLCFSKTIAMVRPFRYSWGSFIILIRLNSAATSSM